MLSLHNVIIGRLINNEKNHLLSPEWQILSVFRELVHSRRIKVSVIALISHKPSTNSYWVGWALNASKIHLTEIDLKVVAAVPTASSLTRFLGHTDCEWQLASDHFGKWAHGSKLAKLRNSRQPQTQTQAGRNFHRTFLEKDIFFQRLLMRVQGFVFPLS